MDTEIFICIPLVKNSYAPLENVCPESETHYDGQLNISTTSRKAEGQTSLAINRTSVLRKKCN